MVGVNHFLAGVSIAVVFKNPFIALPLAFASHFMLDILPHFGISSDNWKLRKLWQLRVAAFDILLLIAAVYLTATNYPVWYVLAGCAAVSPDFAWVYRLIVKEKFGKLPPQPANAFNRWHAGIQKLERPWGIVIEIAVVTTFFAVLFF